MTQKRGKPIAAAPFARVRKWRAKDRHTGIGKHAGIPYTYQHVNVLTRLTRAEVYRIETIIPFVPPTPVHRDCYYVPGDKLDTFFDGWGEHAQIVLDIRPVTAAKALRELRSFQRTTEIRLAKRAKGVN